ncbi:putative gustatory receptor 28b [Leptopilina heterotoma]|uniref:putative gustatory receptor 28b n=1 Tax=Leptopilina heterotoma TaxID=63436 RepID=UPI001CA8779E|nr:putative gustatory receptor 28b [Leptopilina heterotoma]
MLDLPQVTQLVLTLHYPIHVNAVVDFTFTAIINCLGMRFIDINSLLKKILPNNRITRNEKTLHSTYGRIYVISTVSNVPFKKSEEKKLIKVLILKSLYKELTDISVEVNRIYQIQIVILIASFFTVLTGFYYISFAGIFFKNIDLHEHWSAKVNGLLWCIAYSYRFYDITITCSRVSSEAMKTKEILFEIRNATEDEELQCEIDQFTLQITQCPLVFTACGLFTLDYSFFENFIGRVLMYTVILIQFSPDVQNLL